MVMFKKFLKWLFQPYEPKQKSYDSSASGKVIRCHDCGEYGYFVTSWDFGFEYKIPNGWQIIWYGVKPLFLCEKCIEKRREQWSYIISKQRV